MKMGSYINCCKVTLICGGSGSVVRKEFDGSFDRKIPGLVLHNNRIAAL